LAAALAASELKVLLIDSDPQGNSTTGVGVEKSPDRSTLYNVLLRETGLEEAISPTPFDGLALVPADQNLVATNLDLVDAAERESRLQSAVQAVKGEYDYIIVDCPPALDLLTLNALVASDAVLIPIQCEFFALEGISQLIDTIDRVKQAFNPGLRIEGVLLTMYDDRTNLTRQVEADLREFFGNEVFKTIIPRSVRLAEAPSFGKPILAYDPRSRGAEAYIQLAKEILAHAQRGRSESAQSAG
jgi:chromosome partitioning protein